MIKNNPLIIISGPTACGKTSSSIKLARYLISKNKNSEIINFDSLLFYKEISIGTAKPSLEEQNGILHHLVDIQSIENEINASDFVELAKLKISELQNKNILPILVGGSAFYLRALIMGMYEEVTPLENQHLKNKIKEKWKMIYQENGIYEIIQYLKIHDPVSLQNYHENDHYRLVRACEHFDLTKKPISLQKKIFDSKNPYDFSSSKYHHLHFYMNLPKDTHQDVIRKRTEKMIADGLILEVEDLIKMGLSTDLKPLQSIGYKEVIDYLNGNIKTEDELIERIIISTRQLAKSQRTFFNKITPKFEINPLNQLDVMYNECNNFLMD